MRRPRDGMRLESPLKDYAIMLPDYTGRALTKDEDMLRAMAGIMRRVSDKIQCPMLEGLPMNAIDHFIRFFGRGFPSYSWAGWRGKIQVDRTWELKPIYYYDTHSPTDDYWIVWYCRDPSGFESIAWGGDRRIEGYHHRQPFWSEHITFQTDVTKLTANLWPAGTSPRPYTLLRFWSLSVWFKIDDLGVFSGEGKLMDVYGHACGTIALVGLEGHNFSNPGNRLK
ncbi:hypothetical protein B0T16DRAFT_2205 [Cercophora newfieldiana]|uniref:Uncharacterized protein n=1 Tax=Cercophora newfieldiana TaxID=92897 RepID=A0AA39YLU7_9PEZI|nr:hypothetical protein B0T16DRAFT_2205 [Cercophora newfieldiana]